MASLEPTIRMDENAFRAPEKMQSKVGRKPLSDMTNSTKPLAKDRLSSKNFSGFKVAERVQPKAGRKPLGDLTNSNKPQAKEKSLKKNCTENLSAVNEEQVQSWISGEGFLHNHNECIKAQRQSLTMSMDYFLETVALKRDSSASVYPLQPPQLFMDSKPELEKLDEIEIDIPDICSPPTPPTPKSPASPSWSGMNWKNFEFSPLKLKESPVRM